MTDWVKLATRFYRDRAVRRLPDADTEMMFVRSLAYCGGEESGGFVPEDDVQLLSRRRRYDSCVSALLAAGLWTKADGGYQITNWDDWNGELDVLARRRAADRERKRRVRRAAAGGAPPESPSADASADIPQTSPDPERGEGDPEGGTSRREVPHAARASPDPPPRQCPKHINDPDPPNCGACKDARLAWEQHRADRARQRALDAAAIRRTTPRCGRCGTRHTAECTT